MNLPNRKSTRLKGYDYSSEGAYFVTVCTHNRNNIFSDTIVGAIHESPEMLLNSNGLIVEKYINKLNERFDLKVDKYVIMPNHIHLILINERAIRESPLQTRSLISKAIGYLKMNVSRDIHIKGNEDTVWQRSFHDHIIRGRNDYLEIWNYIDTNPQKWVQDCYYKK